MTKPSLQRMDAMFKTLVALLCTYFAASAFAKLGETVPQLVKRFGKSYTVESDAAGKRYKFRSEKLSVDVLVANGVSVAETYFSDHPLTTGGEPPNDIVRAIFKINRSGTRWVEMDAAPFEADYALQSSDHEYIPLLRYTRPQPENSIWTMTVGQARVVRSVSTATPSTPSPATTPLATQTPILTQALSATPVVVPSPPVAVADTRGSSKSNQWSPPQEICSHDNNFCVKIVPDKHPDGCTLVVSSKDRVLAQFATMGYLLDVFYSADNSYVAINNRRANAGDYLWVISLRDGQPLKIPEDVATELGKKELGQISGDHFPPDRAMPEVTALCPECTPDNLNHPFLFSRDWKSSDELNVVEEFHFFGRGAYGPGAPGVWIAVNKICRITGKRLSLVKQSVEKESQLSELVTRAWTWSPFHVRQ